MNLILWRHADAEEGDPDIQRPLSARGHEQARRMGAWLDAQLPADCRILVSPALRTVQTAEYLGRSFTREPALLSGASPRDVLKAAGWPAPRGAVLVVGHQPTLGQTAALLMTGQLRYWSIRKAAAWWFVQRPGDEADGLYLKAVMTAELLEK